jgi:DNA-binding NtrC family response regulator
VQGVYFSRPLSGADRVALLARQAPMDLGPPPCAGARRTVLLAGADTGLQADFCRIAAAFGYQVLLAHCADEAYEQLAGNEVAVVLAGEDLAGDSAIDFFRRIKHMHPRSVRVLLTGDTSAANLANAINRGAIFKFATKPWSDASLTGVLASAFSYYEHF